MLHRKEMKMKILMLPWLAHGHVSPFLELSKLLATKNFHIFFCSTSVILHSIQSKLPQKLLSSNIELVELTLPTSADLPPHHHTTAGLPSHLMFSLKRAFDLAASAFDDIIRNLRPNLVIYDFLQPWAPAVALSADIPAVMFQCTGALMATLVTNMIKFPNSDFPSMFPEIRLSEFEIKQLNNLFRCSVNDAKDKQRIEECYERSCGIFLLKSFREIEAKYIGFLSTVLQIQVIPVGPLVEEPEEDIVLAESFEKWLSKKEKKSCILVSFGSEFYLSKEDMEEIAHGLELSHLNFIWVVRFPASGEGERKKNNNVEEKLPKGFLERVGERGMVVEGWVPQAQILKHQSTGGFLSHCGWSSVLESIKFGIPIIAAPMQLDQPLNARLVEHLGIGVVVERSGGDRLCRREVARAVREVVAEENGKRVREKVKEFAKIMKEKGDEEMEVVVEEITKLCRRKRKGTLQSNWCRTSMDSHCCEVMKIDDHNGAPPNKESLLANK